MAVTSKSELERTCKNILELAEKITRWREDSLGVQEESPGQLIGTLRSALETMITHCSGSELLKRVEDQRWLKNLRSVEERLQKILLQTEIRDRNVDRNSCCALASLLYAKFLDKMFPIHLEDGLKVVQEVLENIFQGLITAHPTCERSVRRPRNDRYVPISETQNAVWEAVKDFSGPSTVLLYGGPGTGKSTLAEHLSYECCYGSEENNIFDLVTVVACGDVPKSKPDVYKTKFNILNDISPSSLVDLRPQDCIASSAGIANAFRALLSVKKTLIILDDVSDIDFLYEMWEATEGVTYVKFLVTSQKSNLCDKFAKDNFVAIRMARPNKQDAGRILASLSECVDKIIPNRLQEVADKIIDATDGNPLALTSIASQLRRLEPHHWLDTYSKLGHLLYDRANPVVDDRANPVVDVRANPVVETEPPRSVFTSITSILDSVRTDAQVLLVLIYACKGESVPEEVLRLLYSATKRSGTFNSSIVDLETRELILSRPGNTIALDEDQTDEHLQQESKAWSCRKLIKLYMDVHKIRVCQSEEVRSVFSALIERDSEIQAVESERRLTIALCAFYFDRAHADELVADVATRAGNALNSNLNITDLRRKETLPIMWLLYGELKLARLMRKVFLKFVYEGQLDYDSLANLLNSAGRPSALSARLSILRSITEIFIGERKSETTPLLNENSQDLLKALVQLTDSKKVSQRLLQKLSTRRTTKKYGGYQPESTPAVERSIQEAALKALLSISRKAVIEKLTFIVATTPDIVTVLVRSIKDYLSAGPSGQSNRSDLFAENAVGTLRNLAFGDLASGVERKSGINEILEEQAREQQAHVVLLELLFKYDQPILQVNAARVLAYLCKEIGDGREAIKLEIVKRNRAVQILEGLSADLGHDHIQPASSVTQSSETGEGESGNDRRALDNAVGRLCQRPTFSKLLDPNYEQRRKAFEPIRLSLREPNLKQAYLKYVSDGLLDFNNIVDIFSDCQARLKKAQNSSGSLVPLNTLLNILKAIENVCCMQSQTPLLSTTHPETSLFEALVRVMSSNDHDEQSLREPASRTLLHIAKKAVEENKSEHLASEDILGALVTSIQDSWRSRRSDTLAANAAKTLRELGYRLAYKQKESNQPKSLWAWISPWSSMIIL